MCLPFRGVECFSETLRRNGINEPVNEAGGSFCTLWQLFPSVVSFDDSQG